MAQRQGLDKYVAGGSGFNGACDHPAIQSICRPLIQQLIATSPPDDVQGVHPLAGHAFDVDQGLAIEQSQTFQCATYDGCLGLRNRLAGFAAVVGNALRHAA